MRKRNYRNQILLKIDLHFLSLHCTHHVNFNLNLISLLQTQTARTQDFD